MDLTRFHELNIILLCGLYGSGKTEFAIKHFMGKERSRISRSEIRKYMFEMTHFGEKWSATDFTEENEALVKHIERKVLEHFLHNKRKVLIINTFVMKKSRKRFNRTRAKKDDRRDLPLEAARAVPGAQRAEYDRGSG
jgi:predicted kinase